jgi:acyl-CoA synthetase (AMP-forming)/AMP-acid ligase II
VNDAQDRSLAALIRERAAAAPDATYLEDARSDRSVSYRRFAEAVDAWGRLLDVLGLPAGSAVVLDLDDTLSFSVVHLAAIANGLRSIPVDPGSPVSALVRQSELVDGAALVVSGREERVALPGAHTADVDPATLEPTDVRSTGAPAHAPASAPGGSAMLFTSGSTGEPKGVELPERQLLYVAHAIALHNRLTPDDRGYNPLPLFHVNAEVVGLLATLDAGATLVLDRRFHRTGFWQLMSERSITWINAVPAILAVLSRGDAIEPPEGLRFVRSASAPLPDPVREAFDGIPLVISYGMTEAASQITATPLGEELRPGSVGVPVGVDVIVRDDAGREVERGATGALWIRGDGVIDGYYRGRAADRFDDEGWLRTGDLGWQDADGFVYIAGRADDVINRGGEKVYPLEVEEVLMRDDRVREAVVVARPDEILGQVPIAYVVTTDEHASRDTDGLIADLGERCAASLPRFKRPVEIDVVPDFPRAATGKVQRSKMRDELAAAATREHGA